MTPKDSQAVIRCDYDTGTAFSGPRKCLRPAKFTWADEVHGKDRPVCGTHARSVRAKFNGTVTAIPGGTDVR